MSKSWAAAATAATTHVSLRWGETRARDRDCNRARERAFQLWLQQHAGQLTALEVQGCYGQLQMLKLKKLNHTMRAAALSSLSLLQHLRLHYCRLVGGGSACLAALGGMQQLQKLSLVWDEGSGASPFRAAEPRDCAALTASSHLTSLELWCETAGVLPPTALQYMFAAGKQLPQLQRLRLRSNQRAEPAGCASAADLHRVCPALVALDVTGLLPADTDLSVFLELPASCCRLHVGGDTLGDNAAPIIAQSTHLTFLEWSESRTVTDAGLLHLTALRQLGGFCTERNQWTSYACAWPYHLVADKKPIWKQLLELKE